MDGLKHVYYERLKKDLASYSEDNETHPQLRVNHAINKCPYVTKLCTTIFFSLCDTSTKTTAISSVTFDISHLAL